MKSSGKIAWGKLDISREVEQFVEVIDQQVEDLSYSVEDLLQAVGREMSYGELLGYVESTVVKNKSRKDASIIADEAQLVLFDKIANMVNELGWINPFIHSVNLKYSSRNKVHCTVLIRAYELSEGKTTSRRRETPQLGPVSLKR